MNQEKQTEMKNRRMKVLTVVGFALALSMLGTNLYLQRRAVTASASTTTSAQQFPAQNPTTVAALQDARIAKAKVLRDQWSSWATQNRDVLKTMLKSKDANAYVRVWQAIPGDPYSISDGSIGRELVDGTAQFSWQPHAKVPVQYKNALDKEEDKVSRQRILNEVKQEVSEHQDFTIATASELGPTGVSLWASGKVTQWTLVGQTVPGKPSFKTVHEEVMPLFDFLN